MAQLIAEVAAEDIEAYIHELVEYAYEKAGELKQVSVLGGGFPKEHRSGIVTLLYPEDWPITPEYLYEHCIGAMPMGKGKCRIAIHYYNNKEDIDRFFAMLAELDNQ